LRTARRRFERELPLAVVAGFKKGMVKGPAR
jgi:hypothetical protein